MATIALEYTTRKLDQTAWWIRKIPFFRDLWDNPVFQLNYARSKIRIPVDGADAFRFGLVFSTTANLLAVLTRDPVMGVTEGMMITVGIPICLAFGWLIVRMFIISLITAPTELSRELNAVEVNPIFATSLSTREIYLGYVMSNCVKGLEFLEVVLKFSAGVLIPYVFFSVLQLVLHPGDTGEFMQFIYSVTVGGLWLVTGVISMMFLLAFTSGIYASIVPVFGAVVLTFIHYMFVKQVSETIGVLFGYEFIMPYFIEEAEFFLTEEHGFALLTGLIVKTIAITIGCLVTAQIGISIFARARRTGSSADLYGDDASDGFSSIISDDGKLLSDLNVYGTTNYPVPPAWVGISKYMSKLWMSALFQQRYTAIKIPYQSAKWVRFLFFYGAALGCLSLLLDDGYGINSPSISLINIMVLPVLVFITLPLLFVFGRLIAKIPSRFMQYSLGEEPVFSSPLPYTETEYLEGECLPEIAGAHSIILRILTCIGGLLFGMLAGLVLRQMFLIPIDYILETFLEHSSPYVLKNLMLALWIIINLVLGMVVLSYALALYTLEFRQEIISVPLAIAHTILSYYFSWQIVCFIVMRIGIDFSAFYDLISRTGEMQALFWAIILQSLCMLIFVWLTFRFGVRALSRTRQTSK